jgi:hypothetical protein
VVWLRRLPREPGAPEAEAEVRLVQAGTGTGLERAAASGWIGTAPGPALPWVLWQRVWPSAYRSLPFEDSPLPGVGGRSDPPGVGGRLPRPVESAGPGLSLSHTEARLRLSARRRLAARPRPLPGVSAVALLF